MKSSEHPWRDELELLRRELVTLRLELYGGAGAHTATGPGDASSSASPSAGDGGSSSASSGAGGDGGSSGFDGSGDSGSSGFDGSGDGGSSAGGGGSGDSGSYGGGGGSGDSGSYGGGGGSDGGGDSYSPGASSTDSATPSYITLGADGSVGASFTGDLVARSLILTGADGSALNASNKVEWQDSAGEDIADVGTYTTTTAGSPTKVGRHLRLMVNPPVVSGEVLSGLIEVFAAGNDATGAPSSASATILSNLGASDFMQLAASGTLKIAGSFDYSFTNIASGATQKVTLTHNLNWSLQVAIGAFLGGVTTFSWGQSTPGSNELDITARNNSSAAGSATLRAFIIGHP